MGVGDRPRDERRFESLSLEVSLDRFDDAAAVSAAALAACCSALTCAAAAMAASRSAAWVTANAAAAVACCRSPVNFSLNASTCFSTSASFSLLEIIRITILSIC